MDFAPQASHEAVALLATVGPSGRYDAPLSAEKAQALYDVIAAHSVADSLSVPVAALNAAGCNVEKWEVIAQASQGSIYMKDMPNGGVGFIVPADALPIRGTLEKWKDPQWHARHAEKLTAGARTPQ